MHRARRPSAALLTIVVAAATLAGCSMGMPRCQHPQAGSADCSYGLQSIISSAWFTDIWNASRAADGLRAAGFSVETERPERVASPFRYDPGDETLAASRAQNGSFELTLEIAVGTGLGLTSAEANELAAQREQEQDARAERVFAAFEGATGWTRDSPRGWMRAIVVT